MFRYSVGELGQTKFENLRLHTPTYIFSHSSFPRDIYQKTMLQEVDLPFEKEIKEALGAISKGTNKIVEKSGLTKDGFYEKIRFDANDIRDYIAEGLAEGYSIKRMEKETLYKIKQRWKVVKPKSKLGELFNGQTFEEPKPKKPKQISDKEYWEMNRNFFSEAKDWINLPGQTEIKQEKLVNLGLYEISNGNPVKVKNYDEKIKKYSFSERSEIKKLEEPSFWKRHPNFKKAVAIGLTAGFVLPLAGCIDKPNIIDNPQENTQDDPVDTPTEYDEGDSGEVVLEDTDGDGMSDVFENKSDLYNPLVKNDRYVILVESYWNAINGWSREEYGKQYDFFNRDMKIPKENIYRIRHNEPGWTKFKEAVNDIAAKADENDFVFAAFTGHGGRSGFIFNTDMNSSWLNEPKQVPYQDINRELNKIKTKAQYIQVNSCSSESSMKYFGKTAIPRVTVVDTNESSCGGSFDLIRSIYPSALSSRIKVYYGKPEENWIKSKWVEVEPDKDKNGFVSMKEAFENARDVYFYGKHPDIPIDLRVVHRYPHMNDPKKIANKLYFGDYPVED